MIKSVVTCDKCKKPCSDTWFSVYMMKGDPRNGKVTWKDDICFECYTKMVSALIER